MTSITFLFKKIDFELLFPDTHSLTYEIKLEDVYEEFFKYKHFLTLVNINQNFFDRTNKKIIGKMKNVYKGKPIREFIGLKSKMDFSLLDDGKQHNVAKRANIAKDLHKYKNILFNKKIRRNKMRRIQVKIIKLEHMKSTMMIKDTS